tara:strand:+ start:374 stop:583 length:210 start_codon:yes stop_codon:yes gene_type:complete
MLKIKDILAIEQVLSSRKIPYDVLDEESVYPSESKKVDVPILEMNIVYFIRCFKKILRENWELDNKYGS